MAQRDQALQQLLEQNRLLQEQNRQLQTPSRSASEDGLDYAAETESLKMRVSLLSEQLEQVRLLIYSLVSGNVLYNNEAVLLVELLIVFMLQLYSIGVLSYSIILAKQAHIYPM